MSVGGKRWFWLAWMCTGVLFGQAELATVTGLVTDSAKAVIPGVKVTIRNVDTDIAHTVDTNQEGYFTIPELPAGSYVLESASPGFEIYRETGIVLQTGQTLRVPVTMTIGSLTESVEVTADVAPLNTENGMVKGYVV